jgi:Fe-S-cluster containining protein
MVEATSISKSIGVPMTPIGDVLTTSEAIQSNMDLYANEPCTFLKEGSCSIYEHRPFACRSHFNTSDTPSICDVALNDTFLVPFFDATTLKQLSKYLLGEATMLKELRDIRNYFPKGAKC